MPRKIMPDVDIVPTRQGSLIGLMVSLSGHRLPAMKNNSFLRLVQPPYKKFPHSPSGYSIFAMLPEFAPADHGIPQYSDARIPLGSGSQTHAIAWISDPLPSGIPALEY